MNQSIFPAEAMAADAAAVKAKIVKLAEETLCGSGDIEAQQAAGCALQSQVGKSGESIGEKTWHLDLEGSENRLKALTGWIPPAAVDVALPFNNGEIQRQYDWQSVGLAQPLPQAVPEYRERDWKPIPVDEEVAQAALKKRKACILAASWQELTLSKPADKQLNQYETNGMDKKRIQKALVDGCPRFYGPRSVNFMALARPLPRHLVLQVDNTVAQAKNGFVGAFCAYVTGKQIFQSVTMNFLMVGHTHEDIDQVFSLLVSQVIRRYRYETVQDLKQYMEAVLAPAFEARHEAFRVTELNSVRSFADWLNPLGVTQHGCWQTRHGIEAPHSFCYKLFKAAHHRWFGAARDKDVMCCVKTYMRDTQLQQPPLCVLPADRLDRIQTFSPDHRVGPSMTAGEMERFKYFADVIDDRRYGYHSVTRTPSSATCQTARGT
eukprot:s2064_g14.t1